MDDTFRSDPARNLHYDFAFNSTRTSGCAVWMDPSVAGPLLPVVRREPALTTAAVRRRLTEP